MVTREERLAQQRVYNEKYFADPENRRKKQEYDRQRLKDPTVKAKVAEYAKGYNAERNKDPEALKRRKEYLDRPEVVERDRQNRLKRYKKWIEIPGNRERKRESDKKYQQELFATPESREKRRANAREYFSKPENKAKRARWYQRYLNKPGKKELMLESKRKWRAKQTCAKKQAENEKLREAAAKSKGRKDQCGICGFDNVRALCIHHIIETLKGGLDIDENKITLCANCHQLVHAEAIDITEFI